MRIKRLLLTLTLAIVSILANAQVLFQTNTNFRQELGRLSVPIAFTPPRSCGFPGAAPSTLNLRPKGFIISDTCNHRIGIWNGSAWVAISGGGGSSSFDTTAIYAALALRVLYTDTASMLAPYRHWLEGYLKVEGDPLYLASTWAVTTNNSVDWDAAYSWGNHASAGYLPSTTAATTYTPLSRTLTINGVSYDLTANRSWTIAAGAIMGLSDVDTAGLADGDFLRYEIATGKWKRTAFPSVLDLSLAANGLVATNYGSVVLTDSSFILRIQGDGRWAQIAHTHAWSNITSGVPANLTSIGALANSSGWLRNNGSGSFSYTFPTATDVGLGNVTNESKATMFTNTTFTGTFATAAGAIGNASLANSSFTLNGTSVSLGGTRTLTLASADFANQGTTTTYLKGNAAGNPSFATIAGSEVTGAALTKTDDTNVTLTLGGTPTTALLRAASITVGWTGTLADSRITSAATWNAKQAGSANLTGLSSLAYVSGTPFVKMTAAGTFALDANTYLTGNQTITLSGPVTGSGTTAITTAIANGAISNAMLANAAVANLSGTNTGDQTTITGNAGSATILQTSRNINGVPFNGSADITVPAAANTLTGSTLNSGVTASSLTSLGIITAGTWNATPISTTYGGMPTGGTINQVLKKNSGTDYDVSWTTLAGGGDMLAANNLSDVANAATARNNILPSQTGANGKVLQSDGTNVSWQTPSGGGPSGLTSTTTAAGTTTLTAASETKQVFNGTSTQTIVLPDATTLTNGYELQIYNNATVALPVNYNDATLLEVLLQGSKTIFTLIDNSTSNGVWIVGELEMLSNTHRKMPLIIGPSGSTTGPTSLGNSVTTGATLSNTTVSNTNQWLSQIHKRFSTSAAAGNASSLRGGAVQFYASNLAGLGGYKAEFICGNGSINLNGSQLFFGLQGSVSQLGGDPSALTNLIAMGYDAADASTGNWFLMHNDGSGVATKIDLGATNAARGTDRGYYMTILVAPNSSTYYVKIVNVNTGALVYNSTLTTNVPAVNTLLGPHVQIRNGAIASAANVDMAYIKIQPF